MAWLTSGLIDVGLACMAILSRLAQIGIFKNGLIEPHIAPNGISTACLGKELQGRADSDVPGLGPMGAWAHGLKPWAPGP